jgi:excisionase family DNA binding protein
VNKTGSEEGDAMLSVPEAAEALSIHPHSVRLAIRDGRLKATKKGTMYWINRADLEAWQAVRLRRLKERGEA